MADLVMCFHSSGIKVAALAVTVCSVLLLSGCWQSQRDLSGRLRASAFFDNDKSIALCNAIAEGDAKAVQQLATPAAVQVVGKDGMTPVLWAILHGSPQALATLMNSGADPHVIIDDDFGAKEMGVQKGLTAVHIAAGLDSPDYLRVLLEHGADANVRTRTISLQSPLFFTLARVEDLDQHWEILQKHGADLDYLSFSGTPASFCAIRLGRFDLSLKLLKAGADPKATSMNGKTRLVHLLLRNHHILSRERSEVEERHYQELLEWLDSHGEPIDRAKAEVATGNF